MFILMNKNEIFQLMQNVFSGLEAGGVIEYHTEITPNTVLIGPSTVLDSVGFVTLFMDLEERLSEITGKEIYLLIDEIHEFNPEDTFLTIEVLVNYIDNMLNNVNN